MKVHESYKDVCEFISVERLVIYSDASESRSSRWAFLSL